jgi:membrane-associated phospholipid phosphatase
MPAPPPPFGSAEFQASLWEVRAFSDTRTAEMTRIAQFYEFGPGTSSPAGQYVELASVLIVRDGLSERDAARVFAVLGVAMADAGIVCWRAKYHYWLLRPSHADEVITMPIGLPNFPAYPSGHSSFSGAAEVVLSAHFPADAAELHRFAEENGLSRIYGGVHYDFDNTAGLELGRRVASLALSAGGRLPTAALAAR